MDSNEPQQSHAEEGSFFKPDTLETPTIRHSGPGIASFILSMVSLIGYIASVAIIGAIVSPNLDYTSPSQSMINNVAIVGLLIILFVLMNIIGVILGIVGTALKNRKKIFAVLGLIINAVVLLSIGAFFIIAVVQATA